MCQFKKNRFIRQSITIIEEFVCCEKKGAMINHCHHYYNSGTIKAFTMQDILKKVHVHMPFHYLAQFQEMVLQKKMNLEIYFSHYELSKLDKAKCRQTAEPRTKISLCMPASKPNNSGIQTSRSCRLSRSQAKTTFRDRKTKLFQGIVVARAHQWVLGI